MLSLPRVECRMQIHQNPKPGVFCQLPRRSITPVIAAAFAAKLREFALTRSSETLWILHPNPRSNLMPESCCASAVMEWQASRHAATRWVSRSMFRVPVGVTGDAGRHFSAKGCMGTRGATDREEEKEGPRTALLVLRSTRRLEKWSWYSDGFRRLRPHMCVLGIPCCVTTRQHHARYLLIIFALSQTLRILSFLF